MKKILLSACIATMAIIGVQADTVVKVTADDGTVNEFLLADTPTVTPIDGGTSLQITAGDATLVVAMDQTYTFTIDESSAIRDITAPASLVSISRNANTVSISGLADGTVASAYTVDGRMLGSVLSNNGSADLDLSNAKGVIIISTPTQSFKILK